MRIVRLYIKRFKNLKNFEITFNPKEPITVLVGRNGSAKSNVIEALVTIFRNLETRQASLFEYELDYFIDGARVEIKNDSSGVRKETVTMPGGSDKENPRNRLPKYTVGFYSGENNRLGPIFQPMEYQYYLRAIGSKKARRTERNINDQRPFILARPIHSQIALVSFLIAEENEGRKFLKERLDIDEIDSILIRLHKPDWATGKNASRFWGARGIASDALKALRKYSLAPFEGSEKLERSIRKDKAEQTYYIYLPDRASIESAVSDLGGTKEFFRAMEAVALSDLIEDFKVKVKMRDCTIPARELSEGERQLLTVLGLMRATRDSNSLYFLDEPDTHLNPAWGLWYMDFLREFGEADTNSHTFIATHDPILVAGLTKEQIRILYREKREDGTFGDVKAIQPESDPKGKGVAHVLTSDLFGLESQLDLETLDLLRQKRTLAIKDKLTRKDYRALESINMKLKGLDYLEVIPDPLYNDLMQAIFEQYSEFGLENNVLTPEEVSERRRIAQEIVAEGL